MDSEWMKYWPLLTGGLGAIATVTWVIKQLRKMFRGISLLVDGMMEIRALLTPNGGSSVADKINGLVETSDSNAQWQKAADTHFSMLDTRLKTVELAILEMKKLDKEVAVNLKLQQKDAQDKLDGTYIHKEALDHLEGK